MSDTVVEAARLAQAALEAQGQPAGAPHVPRGWPGEPITLTVGRGETAQVLELWVLEEDKLAVRVRRADAPATSAAAGAAAASAQSTMTLPGAFPEEIADWIANVYIGALPG